LPAHSALRLALLISCVALGIGLLPFCCQTWRSLRRGRLVIRNRKSVKRTSFGETWKN